MLIWLFEVSFAMTFVCMFVKKTFFFTQNAINLKVMRSSGLILLFILLLCAEILSVQDKHFIRMDSGESYVRSIDILLLCLTI